MAHLGYGGQVKVVLTARLEDAAVRGTQGAPPGCLFCGSPLTRTFVDLGMTPLSNSYVEPRDLSRSERFYPLRAFVCDSCLLVQLEQHESPENIFGEYAYLSSFSETWLEHCRDYTDTIVDRLGLGPASLVVEVGSNDGCLLECFIDRGIPVLGIDPAANVAEVAIRKGVPTLVRFFGEAVARELVASGEQADLLVGNNVLAHAPRLNDFVGGMKRLLGPRGVITVEFPHVMRLIENNEFDTIYHEHYFYFSLLAVQRVFESHGLKLFDVEELQTHGGSLRIHVRHEEDESKPAGDAVAVLLSRERQAGLDRVETYELFSPRVERAKRNFLKFLIEAREAGHSIVAYGAAAKGNTLLNYCGVRTDLIEYVVDRSPYKQGRHLPGTRIPVYNPDRIRETRPDYVLILPWNLEQEIVAQLAYIRAWGGQFVIPIPEVRVVA